MQKDFEKKVDVIIPTYNPEKEFYILIRRLLEQSYNVNKIIIVNTVTSDEDLSDKCIKEFGEKVEVHNIDKKEFNHGLTRNYGASFSKADYVVFMTQDAVPYDNELIYELLKPFDDEDVYVSYARQLPRKNCKYVEKYVRSFNYPKYDIVKTKEDFEQMGIKTIFCSDVCAAYRREEHVKLGGFEKTDFNEDMLFAYKTVMEGKKVYYTSEAKVIHSHNYTYIQQLKRNIEIGKSQKEFDYIFGKIKSESEGVKMVKKGIKHLLKKGKWYLIPDLIISSGFKFVGFRIGKL